MTNGGDGVWMIVNPDPLSRILEMVTEAVPEFRARSRVSFESPPATLPTWYVAPTGVSAVPFTARRVSCARSASGANNSSTALFTAAPDDCPIRGECKGSRGSRWSAARRSLWASALPPIHHSLQTHRSSQTGLEFRRPENAIRFDRNGARPTRRRSHTRPRQAEAKPFLRLQE